MGWDGAPLDQRDLQSTPPPLFPSPSSPPLGIGRSQVERQTGCVPVKEGKADCRAWEGSLSHLSPVRRAGGS